MANSIEPAPIDLEELTKRVRQAVAAQKARRPRGRRKRPASKIPRMEYRVGPIQEKTAYTLDELLKYHDDDFVKAAFQAVLGREADAGLPLWVGKLRAGKRSKIEVLGRMRYSREGRARGVRIPGLLPKYILNTSFRVPVFGPLARAVLQLARISRSLRALDQLAGHVERELDRVRAGYNRIAAMLDTEGAGSLSTQLEHVAQQNSQRLFALEQALLRIERLEVAAGANGRDAPPRGLDELYVALEDRFRGSPEQIKQRVADYLPIIRRASAGTGEAPILDLGCGRGEWLELLREEGLEGRGIDSNKVMVTGCRERGLAVKERDLLDELRSVASGALGAVTAFHVVEHLPFETLLSMLDEALRVLRPGGVAIFETPSPENLIVGACNFYCDPTHRHPIPQDLLKFLVEARGFARAEVRPLTAHRPMPRPPEPGSRPDPIGELARHPYDYALIAYKG